MTFSELGIRRHVMAFMVAASIILFGAVSYFNLGIDEFPDVDLPYIIVVVTQTGADAKTMDDTVTSVLLENLNGISGIDTITGQSSSGRANVMIQFLLEKDVDVAFNEVQSKINESLGDLPNSIDTPQILKVSVGEEAFLTLALTGNRSLRDLNEYADKVIKKELQTINGVSEIQIRGERAREIRIDLDLNKVAYFSLGLSEIRDALQKAHVQLPAGQIVAKNSERVLNLDLEYHSVDDLKNLIVKNNGGAFVRLSDIAEVTDGVADFRGYASLNSQDAISLGVAKISGFNTFSIEKEVLDRVNNSIIPNLQDGMNLEVTNNTVDYIRASVAILKEHLVLGTILTAFVVFLFLRSLRSTLIIAVSIPVSLMGAIVVMNLLGYTFNNITLLALLLLIGIVVDDAIIVLENIYRKIEMGDDPVEASIHGANQIFFAVLAATLSLVSIFGPMMFMSGIVGRFFQSFAVVVTCGVLISYFVAIYIVPMLCSRYLRQAKHSDRKILSNFFEDCFQFLEKYYTKLLSVCLRFKGTTLLIALLFFLSSFLFFSKIPLEFVAEGDKSAFNVLIQTPIGSNIYYTLEKTRIVENIIKKHPEVKNYVTIIGFGRNSGVNRAKIEVKMVPIDNRTISQDEFVNKIQAELLDISGTSIVVSSGGGVGGGEYKMSFNITGPNLEALYDYSLKLQEAYRDDPRLSNIDLGMELLPQLEFTVDRDKAALLGLTSEAISQAIGFNVGGTTIGKFSSKKDTDTNDRYDIVLKAKDNQFMSIDNLKDIYVKNSQGTMIRLDSVVQYKEFLGFSAIQREGSMYSATFNANPTVPIGEALKVVEDITAQIVPADYKIVTTGSAKEMMKTALSVIIVFSMAIIMLYMVLASQFNSFIQPLVIMVTVPLAIVGGVFGLYITGFSLNMFSMIGLILLVGLVAKNAILLIDFTNEIRTHGKSVEEALLEACPIRLRPILMTSLTIILSMIPAVFATGEGSENNASLSIVVVGGMISSTLLTLVVIPVFYNVIESFIEKRKIKKNIVQNIEQI